jgi:hypothetical protein
VSAASVEIRPLAELERDAILGAIRAVGDKLEAARKLGIGKTTLYRKIKEFGVVPVSSRHIVRAAASLAEIPIPSPKRVPIQLLRMPSTRAEQEQAHLRCPRCRTMLCE